MVLVVSTIKFCCVTIFILILVTLLGSGLLVNPVESDGKKGTPMSHRILLSGLYADTPARMKIANTMCSASAYLACHWCCFAGAKAPKQSNAEETGRGMLFRGYATPAYCAVGILQKQSIQLHHDRYDNAKRVLTTQDMWDRGEFVESKSNGTAADKADAAKVSGCLGLCSVMKALPYTVRQLLHHPIWARRLFWGG